jgi:hypothetical protein
VVFAENQIEHEVFIVMSVYTKETKFMSAKPKFIRIFTRHPDRESRKRFLKAFGLAFQE